MIWLAYVGSFHGVTHPAVELDATVVVAGSADRPDDRETEPRLDQLSQPLYSVCRQRPVTLTRQVQLNIGQR